ncbi:hypothetical protein OUZ56_009366 [Daphnia magna]|uniref:Uncharacterized protein n=1 Tax=Daphnia magna TaxID=35525 RepID=A0ABR0AFS0_9CRUS|nr:hypothetical protein OUZ56_009366 [Daphnia magna]
MVWTEYCIHPPSASRHPFKYSVDLDVSTPTAEGPSVLIDTEETRNYSQSQSIGAVRIESKAVLVKSICWDILGQQQQQAERMRV